MDFKINKRLIFNCLNILFAMFLMSAICPQKAHAYLDPGTGSMILQVILAGIVGIGCTFRVWGQKFVGFIKKFSKKG